MHYIILIICIDAPTLVAIWMAITVTGAGAAARGDPSSVIRGDQWLLFEPLATSIGWVFEAFGPATAMVTMLCIIVT